MNNIERFEHWWKQEGQFLRLERCALALESWKQAAPTQGADARPVAMTNGSFHCPACGEAMKGPLACGHCLWQKPEAVDAEIGADGIATRDAAPSDAPIVAWIVEGRTGKSLVWDSEIGGYQRAGLTKTPLIAASAPRDKT